MSDNTKTQEPQAEEDSPVGVSTEKNITSKTQQHDSSGKSSDTQKSETEPAKSKTLEEKVKETSHVSFSTNNKEQAKAQQHDSSGELSETQKKEINIKLEISNRRTNQEWVIILAVLLACSGFILLLSCLVFAIADSIPKSAEKTSVAFKFFISTQPQLDWHILVFCSALLLAPVFMLSRLTTHAFQRDRFSNSEIDSASKDMPIALVVDAFKNLPETLKEVTEIIKKMNEAIKK